MPNFTVEQSRLPNHNQNCRGRPPRGHAAVLHSTVQYGSSRTEQCRSILPFQFCNFCHYCRLYSAQDMAVYWLSGAYCSRSTSSSILRNWNGNLLGYRKGRRSKPVHRTVVSVSLRTPARQGGGGTYDYHRDCTTPMLPGKSASDSSPVYREINSQHDSSGSTWSSCACFVHTQRKTA